MRQRFEPGRVVATQAAGDVFPTEVLIAHLKRHLSGDWGDVTPHDSMRNETALLTDERLVSVYKIGELKLLIITEHDRSSTCFMLPEDY